MSPEAPGKRGRARNLLPDQEAPPNPNPGEGGTNVLSKNNDWELNEGGGGQKKREKEKNKKKEFFFPLGKCRVEKVSRVTVGQNRGDIFWGAALSC